MVRLGISAAGARGFNSRPAAATREHRSCQTA